MPDIKKPDIRYNLIFNVNFAIIWSIYPRFIISYLGEDVGEDDLSQ